LPRYSVLSSIAPSALEALRNGRAHRRSSNGQELNIPARDLVPGDVVYLRAGDKIPGDGRVFEAVNLKVDEAPLTGDSVPVEKQTAALLEGEPAIADRTNMVFAGTNVTYGRGRAIIVATGMATEFGRIAESLQAVTAPRTPLQQSLEKVAAILARVAVVIVIIIVGLGLLRGQALLEMIIFGIALAVAVVPGRARGGNDLARAQRATHGAAQHWCAVCRRWNSRQRIGDLLG
jgi:Ca2+-transporting ATPase